MKVKTPADLKFMHLTHNPASHYFECSTMKAFGDTMANYKVIDRGTCYELARKMPVKEGLDASAFFAKDTFKRLHGRLVRYTALEGSEPYVVVDTWAPMWAPMDGKFLTMESFKRALRNGVLPSSSYALEASIGDFEECKQILHIRELRKDS